MRGLFVTGTDTDVGKTFLSALIIKLLRKQGYKLGAYKPACSGAKVREKSQTSYWEDVQTLSGALDDLFPPEWICPQCFRAPLAPPVAAQNEGKSIDEQLLSSGVTVWQDQVEGILIEGVGGWKCPLSDQSTIESLAQEFGFPVLVVAAQKLGAINHTLLTIDAIRQSGLHVAGVILNQTANVDCNLLESNAEQIRKFANVPFLALTQFEHRGELECWQSNDPVDLWNIMAPSSTGFLNCIAPQENR